MLKFQYSMADTLCQWKKKALTHQGCTLLHQGVAIWQIAAPWSYQGVATVCQIATPWSYSSHITVQVN